jgi:hypothetical protein
MTRIGTCHFKDYQAALRYYLPYNGGDGIETKKDVDRKLRDKEIKLGRPEEQPGQRTFLIDEGTRWAIEEQGQ